MKKEPFIRDIDDPTLVLRCIEEGLVIWFDEATRCAEEPNAKKSIAAFNKALRFQIGGTLRDLKDRRERLALEECARASEEEYLNADRRTARRSDTL